MITLNRTTDNTHKCEKKMKKSIAKYNLDYLIRPNPALASYKTMYDKNAT